MVKKIVKLEIKKLFSWFKKVENGIFILGYVVALVVILRLMITQFKDDLSDFDFVVNKYPAFALAGLVFIFSFPLWIARMYRYIFLSCKDGIIIKSCKLFKKHISKKCNLTECNSQIHEHTKKCNSCHAGLVGA